MLVQEIRYALRQLRKNPGFATVAVVTLAFGIGANTAIFTVVNGVILRPPPFPNSEQLVTLFEQDRKKGYDQNAPAAANFLDWRAQNNVFSQMAAYGGGEINLTGDQRPERASRGQVLPKISSLYSA
jgi:putative ABC transport system permease protein